MLEREVSSIQGIEQERRSPSVVEVSKYVPVDEVEAMVSGEMPVFPIGDKTPEVLAVRYDEERPRNANIYTISHGNNGEATVASHCIRFPSSLARAIAGFRNRAPNAHVSTELRRVDPSEAAQYTGLFMSQQQDE